MVATTINMLNGHDVDYETTGVGEIETHVLTGLTPGLITSEQRAKVVYEYLYRQINDKYVKETIDFLLNREEAHNALFRDAFNKVQNSGSNKDFGVTQDSKLYFNLSIPSAAGSGMRKNMNVNPPGFS